MRVLSNDIICGIEAKVLRSFLRKYKNFSSKKFLEVGNKNNLNCLLKNEFIISDKKKFFNTTVKGNALAASKFIKAINREKADNIVTNLIKRANQINTDEYFIVYVDKIYAFGSYIKKTIDVGDIDLVAVLILKETISKDDAQNISHERTKNKNMSFIDRLFFAIEIEPMKFLKNREQYLNFHRKDELEQLNIKPKLIFKRK